MELTSLDSSLLISERPIAISGESLFIRLLFSSMQLPLFLLSGPATLTNGVSYLLTLYLLDLGLTSHLRRSDEPSRRDLVLRSETVRRVVASSLLSSSPTDLDPFVR